MKERMKKPKYASTSTLNKKKQAARTITMPATMYFPASPPAGMGGFAYTEGDFGTAPLGKPPTTFCTTMQNPSISPKIDGKIPLVFEASIKAAA